MQSFLEFESVLIVYAKDFYADSGLSLLAKVCRLLSIIFIVRSMVKLWHFLFNEKLSVKRSSWKPTVGRPERVKDVCGSRCYILLGFASTSRRIERNWALSGILKTAQQSYARKGCALRTFAIRHRIGNRILFVLFIYSFSLQSQHLKFIIHFWTICFYLRFSAAAVHFPNQESKILNSLASAKSVVLPAGFN